MLETPAAAKWLKMTPRQLLAGSRGKRAKIPAFWINKRVVRFHPRTIITKFAQDAGLPFELVASAFNLRVSDNSSTETKSSNDDSNHQN